MSKYIKTALFVAIFTLVLGWVISIQFESKENTYTGLPHKNKPAPGFTLKDESGKTVSLNQFKGKLIYLKFWTSWCGDCIKQVVPQRKIEDQLAKDDRIVFINISVDDDLQAWHKSVKRNKLIGYELISRDGDEDSIDDNYGISEIPRYILIGKDGNVLDNNAPKPSEIDVDYFYNFLK